MMMNNIKRLLPNTSRSQGWKNPKFHLLLHFVDMIVCFGAPKNYDSQCPEHNHKYLAKKPGRRSRKTNNASEFETQVARRVCEARIIDEIHETINPTNSVIVEQNNANDNAIIESMHYASKAKVIRSGVETYTIHWKRYKKQLKSKDSYKKKL